MENRRYSTSEISQQKPTSFDHIEFLFQSTINIYFWPSDSHFLPLYHRKSCSDSPLIPHYLYFFSSHVIFLLFCPVFVYCLHLPGTRMFSDTVIYRNPMTSVPSNSLHLISVRCVRRPRVFAPLLRSCRMSRMQMFFLANRQE